MSTKRRSVRGKETRFGKHSIRRHSIRRPSVVSFDGQDGGEDEDFMQIYNEEEEVSSEEEIFENIKLQKEIIENIRTQPWRIRKKLQVLRLAKDYVEKYEGRLSRSHGYQEKGAKAIRRIKREFLNFIAIFIPWEMRVKKIESHYGSVVASYFVFLRWLVWINIWLTLLPIGFIMIPEVIAGKPYGSTNRKTIPKDVEAEAYNLKTIWDAEGVVQYSIMLYGYYGNEETIGAGYRLPLAYFLTGIGSFAFSFIMVLRQMATNARMSRLSSKDEQFTFAWKMFTSWDFMIGQAETANQKFASVATTFRESILEEKEKTKDENKKLIIFLRVVANILVCISLGLSTWAIQTCVQLSREVDIKKRREQYQPSFWEENQVTVIMTTITTLFPSLFDLIALMEKYHPRVNLRWQLGRIFVLNLLSIYTLFIALFWKRQDLTTEIERQLLNSTTTEWRNVTVPCPTEKTTSATSGVTEVGVSAAVLLGDTLFGNFSNISLAQNCTRLELHNVTLEIDSDLCWETSIGQEVLKLTILDLVFTAGNVIVVDFLRGLCVRYTNVCCCWDLEKQFPEYGEFKTAENILHLINNQGMIWLGTFFCPGLPLINLLKLLMLLYMRNWAVMVCNVPQDRIFRASRSNNFYFAMLLVMLFLCTLPVAFAMVLMKPSPSCGPFSGMDFMMDVITTTMDKELPDVVNTVLDYVASPAVIIPLFLLLSLGIYYLIALSRALREANNDLKMQLEYERTDGRKKVYAMAAVKDGDGSSANAVKGFGDKSNGGKGGRSGKRMAGAATRMSRMLSSTNPPPVAVVRGKPSYPRRVPPSVAPRPRRPLPGNPQGTRQSLQNVTSRLLQNRDENAVESRGRRNLRNLAMIARNSATSDQWESTLSRNDNRQSSRTEETSRVPQTKDRSRGQAQANVRNGRQRQQKQQQQQQQRRHRSRNATNAQPGFDASGRRFAGEFIEEDDAAPEDEFSRYTSEDLQQSERLLRDGRSVDSGIHIENNITDEGYEVQRQSSSGQRRRQYLSVGDEDDFDSEEEEEDERNESESESETDETQLENEQAATSGTNVTFVDETKRRVNIPGPTETEGNSGVNMSDPSFHTNAVYEEDFDSDDLDETPEGILSASGHLIPRIRVTDFSDGAAQESNGIAPEGGSDEPTRNLDMTESDGRTGNDELTENDAPEGVIDEEDTVEQPPPVKPKPTNWRSRQRTVEQSEEEELDLGPPIGPPSHQPPRTGLFKAMNVFKRAARTQNRSRDMPIV
ncbi:transmembrane channel-like protein 3 [Liolophura sinensis]|uniref:transmembrane channel-like protein 3 n=1 Tax=Liolophura sinensis TaxID=3198878 RepID=UPI003159952F